MTPAQFGRHRRSAPRPPADVRDQPEPETDAPVPAAAPAAAAAPTPDLVLTGLVRTADGWTLPGATVTVVTADGRQAGRAFSDTSGGYSIELAEGGPVTVIVAAPGMQPTARRVTAGRYGRTEVGEVVLVTDGRTEAPPPGRYVIDPAHTIIRATARHLGLSHVEGRFTRFAGEIRLAGPLTGSEVQVTIEAASIDTGDGARDRHLRSPDFLDVERFPVLTFHSDRVVLDAPDHGRVHGMLTIRDMARRQVLDVTFTGNGPDPWGGHRIALLATTQLARSDYGMNWNMGVPGGLPLVGPTLRIELEVQGVLQDDTRPADGDGTSTP